ncbi:hypothetical protein AAA538_05920 [Pseudomonas aeruginosa]
MKSDPQVPAAVDAAPPAALNKAVEVTLAKVHWHQGKEKAAGEKINVKRVAPWESPGCANCRLLSGS